MVRWIDGFYGGLIAGGTSALFYAVVAVAWLHDVTLGAFFAQVAQALPPFHGAPASVPLAVLGFVLYLLVAAAFGIAYATLARRLPSMWRAPTSVLWGLAYGLLVWWLLNDVLVPGDRRGQRPAAVGGPGRDRALLRRRPVRADDACAPARGGRRALTPGSGDGTLP